MSGDRSKFIRDRKIIHGIHPEGILEIIFDNPKKKNAFFTKQLARITELFIQANLDDSVKCVVIQGGEFFSAGNDVEAF